MWSVRILTYNMFTPVAPPLRVYGQAERASRVGEVVAQFADLDVVVLNEAIVPWAFEKARASLHALGFVHHTEQLQDPFSVAGGVVIFSRHPLTQQERSSFGDKCHGIDCLASKGVVYARVCKDGTHYFNVFATHMQAWPHAKAQATRRAQIQQTRRFMETLRAPAPEPVFFVGDMNTDMYLARNNLQSMTRDLGLRLPPLHPESHPFTVDPQHNQLVGNDDPDEYQSEDWPLGCAEDYYQTLRCPCCPEEWLDYTLYSRHHLQPTSSHMRAVAVKVKPFRMEVRAGQTVADMRDVSDHFPVVGHFEFAPVSAAESSAGALDASAAHPAEVYGSGTLNLVWALTACVVLASLCVALLVWVAASVYRAWGFSLATSNTLQVMTPPVMQP